MICAFVVVTLLAGAADRAAPVRPKSSPKAKPAPKPPPPPPAELDEPDEPDAPEPVEPPDDGSALGTRPDVPTDLDGDDPFKGDPEELRKKFQGILVMMMCGCLCVGVGVIALIIFLVKRSSPKPAGTSPPPPAQAAARPIPFHLSVLAVGMQARARQEVAQQLILAGVQADPVSAPERTQLVRELSKAVRTQEAVWTHFGYGERLDLADEAAAQNSYQLAVDDFSKRSADPSHSGDTTYTVLTLVLCTRRQLRGVSALDDRAQIRVLLDERSGLVETDLMGAFVVWSEPIGGHEVLTRFPEMHAVR